MDTTDFIKDNLKDDLKKIKKDLFGGIVYLLVTIGGLIFFIGATISIIAGDTPNWAVALTTVFCTIGTICLLILIIFICYFIKLVIEDYKDVKKSLKAEKKEIAKDNIKSIELEIERLKAQLEILKKIGGKDE